MAKTWMENKARRGGHVCSFRMGNAIHVEGHARCRAIEPATLEYHCLALSASAASARPSSIAATAVGTFSPSNTRAQVS